MLFGGSERIFFEKVDFEKSQQTTAKAWFNSFLASNDLSSAENLCKQFGPDLDLNCLLFLKDFYLKKLILKKIGRRQQKHIPWM